MVHTSPNNTVIVGSASNRYGTLQQSITDSHGNLWAITPGGQVEVNGVIDQSTNRVTELAYENGVVWQLNSVGNWYGKSSPSQSWYPTYGTTVSPIPANAPMPGVTYFDGATVAYVNAA